jgi:hypothetical protein
MNYIDEQTKFKSNYYALYISIVTRKNASESLRSMGLTEGININAIKKIGQINKGMLSYQ